MTAHTPTTADESYALSWAWPATDSATLLRDHLNAAIDYPSNRPDFRVTHTEDGTVGVTLHSAGRPDLDVDSKVGALRARGISFSVVHKKLICAELPAGAIPFGSLIQIAADVVDAAKNDGVDMSTSDLMFASGVDNLPPMLSYEVSAESKHMAGLADAKYSIVGSPAPYAPAEDFLPAPVIRKLSPDETSVSQAAKTPPAALKPAAEASKPSPVPRPRPAPTPAVVNGTHTAAVLTIEILDETNAGPAPELLLHDEVEGVDEVDETSTVDGSDFDDVAVSPDADGNVDF